MIKGFRDFIMRGNVIDLAVAVIIGAAFTAIVTSFVTNVLTPAHRIPGRQAGLLCARTLPQWWQGQLRHLSQLRDLVRAASSRRLLRHCGAHELRHEAAKGKTSGGGSYRKNLCSVQVVGSHHSHALQVLHTTGLM